MANTMPAPVANSVSLATKCVPYLDEVYARESLTRVLDALPAMVNWVGVDTAKVFKIDVDGLGDYNRNAGYVPGSTDGTWETLQIQKDRARSFNVDAMDAEETMGQMLATLAQFERTAVIPEIDAKLA